MDKYYAVFILGFDLLHAQLLMDDCEECDLTYEFCCSIFELFIKSGYNENMNYSDYENLQRFINDHDLKTLKSMMGVG